MWVCQCDCGGTKTTTRDALVSGEAQSCGCLHKEGLRARTTTHGKTKTPEYAVWQGMIARCYRPNCIGYRLYGARGIAVCDAWRHSFEAFYRDMGPRPSKRHQIERMDNDGPYSPENCTWVTHIKQVYNRRVTIWITIGDETLLVPQWAERMGISAERIRLRLRRGWSPAAAVLTPNTGRGRVKRRVEGEGCLRRGASA